jgi:hypothetical protein
MTLLFGSDCFWPSTLFSARNFGSVWGVRGQLLGQSQGFVDEGCDTGGGAIGVDGLIGTFRDFVAVQLAEPARKDITQKRREAVDAARGLPADGCEQKVHRPVAVEGRVDGGLGGEYGIVKLFLLGGEIDRHSLRLALREFADVSPESPVHQAGPRMEPLNVANRVHTGRAVSRGIGQRVIDLLEAGIPLKDGLPPGGLRCLEQRVAGFLSPAGVSLPGGEGRLIDAGVGLCDCSVAGFVDDHIWAEGVEENE